MQTIFGHALTKKIHFIRTLVPVTLIYSLIYLKKHGVDGVVANCASTTHAINAQQAHGSKKVGQAGPTTCRTFGAKF